MSSADGRSGATLLPPARDGTVALPGGRSVGHGRYGAATFGMLPVHPDVLRHAAGLD